MTEWLVHTNRDVEQLSPILKMKIQIHAEVKFHSKNYWRQDQSTDFQSHSCKKKKKKFLGTTVYNVQTLDQEQCSRAKTMCLCTQTPASSTMPDTQQGLGTRVLN